MSDVESLVAKVLTEHQIDGDSTGNGAWVWWCTCPAFSWPAAPQQQRSEAEALAAAHIAHEVVAALTGAGLLGKPRWGVQMVDRPHAYESYLYEFTSEVDARNAMAGKTDRVLLVRRDATDWREVADG